MPNLSYESALGTMRAIAAYTSADFDALGIQPQDFALTYEATPWTRDNRRRVMATLDALLFGTLDVMGLPRIAVPAEYAAAIISTFVAPLNRQVACVWMAEGRVGGRSAMDLAAGGNEGDVDPASASQLFSLCVLLSDTDVSTAVRQQFRARMNERTQNLIEG